MATSVAGEEGGGPGGDASAPESRVSDPTSQRFPSAKRRASMAAAEQLETVKCLHLMGEYRQCISANYQMHQMYIHGQFSQCKEQKARMYNCMKWKTSHNEKAKEALLASFEGEHLAMHTPDPVWRMRSRPPEEWNHPDPGNQPSSSSSSSSSFSSSSSRH